MRSRDSVHKMCQDISKVHTNGVDILVNNAGKESLYLHHVEYKLNFNVMSEHKNTQMRFFLSIGINHVEAIEEYPDAKWDEMISIMLSTPFDIIKFFIPLMKKKGKTLSTSAWIL